MSDAKQLEGKVLFVTGAGGGLGASVRTVFESAGATIVRGTPRHPGPPWHWFDATDAGEALAAVDAAVRDHARIDILINLVGTWTPQPPLHELPDETLERMMTVNFRSAFVMCRAVLPHMLRAGSGRIINVGARPALKGSARNAAYSASKAAVVAMTESIAEEVAGKGITANVIIPSTIDTPANRKSMPEADFSKWVRPEAIAGAMLFLCTEAGGSINGARIPVWNRS
jgi:NAD(P)-dependent dehydrogenase (short-subunit alcohol dehydrogenase family)